MVLMSTDALTSRGFYITLGSWIGDTAHLAARLQSENGGLIRCMGLFFRLRRWAGIALPK